MADILILGRTGQVATALAERLPRDGHAVNAWGRDRVNLANANEVRVAIERLQPGLVINAAAFTAVDKAETDEAAAEALNAVGPAAAAAAAASLGVPFIQFSTDYVFDGSKGAPYVEDDPVAPLGVYGRSKLNGERAVAAANPQHLILRTAWVCSAGGANFLRTMLRLAPERKFIGVVDDQRGTPTFARDLADATAALVNRLVRSPPAQPWGVFHAVSQGDATWCDFAKAIMEGSRRRGGAACEIRAISTGDYPTPAKRPQDSRLDTQKLFQIYGTQLPHWRTALDRCLDEIYGLNKESAQ